MSYLENTGDALPRYPDQKILYDWNYFEGRSALPHGAFIGQCDPFSNGTEWIIFKAGEAINAGNFGAAPSGSSELVSLTNNPLTKDYEKNLPYVYLTANAAITEDQFEGASIGFIAESSGFNGDAQFQNLTNRISGNSPAAAANDEFRVELDFPMPFNLKDTEVDQVSIVAHSLNGVEAATSATDVVSVFCPVKTMSGYYYKGLIKGTILAPKASADTWGAGDALTTKTGTHGVTLVKAAAGEQIVAFARDGGSSGITREWVNLALTDEV